MASVFDYIFNIGGNFTSQMNGMNTAVGNFSGQVEGAESQSRKLVSTLASFTYLKDVFQNLADGVASLSSAGIQLDSQLYDFSAVASVAGETLEQVEYFARKSAKAFGTDVGAAVEGYKLLLPNYPQNLLNIQKRSAKWEITSRQRAS